MRFQDPKRLEIHESATGVPFPAVGLLPPKQALADVREVVALRSTRAGAELATFRRLKIKSRR
jgi:hypothetical protein